MNTPNFVSNLLAIQDRLYQFACRLTANVDAARDLLQETSLAVLNNEELYTPDTNFSAWCHTIMRNSFVNRYRKAIRERTYTDTTDELYYLNVAQYSVDSDMDTREILQIIGTLPNALYEPFIMYINGFKYREISEKMKVPIGTVKSRIFTSKDLLKKQLVNYNV